MEIKLTKTQQDKVARILSEKIIDLLDDDSEEFGWDIASEILAKHKKTFKDAVTNISAGNINKLVERFIAKKLGL